MRLLSKTELLNEAVFYDLSHAREGLARWAASYNQTRPHSALGYLTPAAFARTFTATAAIAARAAAQMRRSTSGAETRGQEPESPLRPCNSAYET